MTIRSFAFEDLETGWKLEETKFQQLNLLIGPSGAGKTRILDALLRMRETTTNEARHSSSWKARLKIGQRIYTWSASTRLLPDPAPAGNQQQGPFLEQQAVFTGERLIAEPEVEIVARTTEEFRFMGDLLPKLSPAESAVNLLESEEVMAPIFDSFQSWFLPDRDLLDEPGGFDRFSGENARERWPTLEALVRARSLTPLKKAYVLEQDHPEVFASIVESFREIFPSVLELRFGTHADFGVRPIIDTKRWDPLVTIGIREENIDRWIVRDISAGMLKVLVFLINLTLATPGSVFLVDELENSLGVNCLPELAELLLGKSHEVQFILTSHHPQVINKIPPRYWKLVTRRGSTVRVIDAETIPVLKTASPLEKFTQLINLPEFEEGVA